MILGAMDSTKGKSPSTGYTYRKCDKFDTALASIWSHRQDTLEIPRAVVPSKLIATIADPQPTSRIERSKAQRNPLFETESHFGSTLPNDSGPVDL